MLRPVSYHAVIGEELELEQQVQLVVRHRVDLSGPRRDCPLVGLQRHVCGTGGLAAPWHTAKSAVRHLHVHWLHTVRQVAGERALDHRTSRF